MTAVRLSLPPPPSADDWDSRPTSLRFPDLRHTLTVYPSVFTVYDESIVRASPSILDREGLVLQRNDLSIHCFRCANFSFNRQ